MGRDLSKGDLPILILAVLAEGPCHGYALAREIERRSERSFTMREGSLYPALRVLEQDGFIDGGWDVTTGGNARKVYTLTHTGRDELTKRQHEWKKYVETFASILGGNKNAKNA